MRESPKPFATHFFRVEHSEGATGTRRERGGAELTNVCEVRSRCLQRYSHLAYGVQQCRREPHVCEALGLVYQFGCVEVGLQDEDTFASRLGNS